MRIEDPIENLILTSTLLGRILHRSTLEAAKTVVSPCVQLE